MTNIYNKTVLSNKGTLVGNWYEESVLRNFTGEGRTIPGRHMRKTKTDFTKETVPNFPKDDTFSRTMGEKLDCEWDTNNHQYGKFEQSHKDYQQSGIKERLFEDFFKGYVSREEKERKDAEDARNKVRLYETSNRNTFVPQPMDTSNLGKRIMNTKDHAPVEGERVDKLFMASHDMSKFPRSVSDQKAENFVDKYVPYYKDKEVTFWSMNLDKGNAYRSFTQGENAFAKSAAFTQPIGKTRGVQQFEGNATNSSAAKNLYLNENDEEFSRKYQANKQERSRRPDYMPVVREKVLSVCSKKGSFGLRKLKLYLRNLNKKANNFIHKEDLKYFFTNFGIHFNDKEIEFIYECFDNNKKNEVDFINVVDSLRPQLNENRLEAIDQFYQQVKKDDGTVSYQTLESLTQFDYHPEVCAFKRCAQEVKYDYLTAWDNLREDDKISEDNFKNFFEDVSCCLEEDENFIDCLRSCGLNI